MVVLAVGAGMLGGCGSTRSAQDYKRLQSQVTLLEQRLSQLERAGTWSTSASPAAPIESAPVSAPAAPAAKAASPAPVSAPSIKPSTREIQQALKNAGFYQGAVDGKMGPITKEAVREFQRVHGLKDDGLVGRQTWSQLSAYASLSGAPGEATAAEPLK
jgi:peptidoglycan hydrolase-like protein with peptidoglycan-binding domain